MPHLDRSAVVSIVTGARLPRSVSSDVNPRTIEVGSGETHPRHLTLHLAAWKLSGDNNSGEDFRWQRSTNSWSAIESTQNLQTSQPGEIGQIGVGRNVRISCLTI